MYLPLWGKNVSAFIELANFVYTIYMGTSSSKNSTIGESVHVEAANFRKLHRVAASPYFHGNKSGRLDVVLLENDESCDVTDVSRARRILMWFAEALAFLRFFKKLSSKSLAENFPRPSLAKNNAERSLPGCCRALFCSVL